METLERPKSSTARNVDSRKKANSPSAASGAPKMSPTKREYVAQLVPKANSIAIPVATPTANVAVKILIQKSDAALSSAAPLL